MAMHLRYGREGLDVALDERDSIEIFRTKPMPGIEDPETQLHVALKNPVGTRPLREIAMGRKDACIVISDITRPVPHKVLLPPILDVLGEAGLRSRDICLLVATGTHRAATETELIEMLGDEITATYEIFCHDARDPSAVTCIGHSSRGTPIELSCQYLTRDVKIVTGLVEPHFMAGYSGGRKSVAIGLISVNAIKQLHGTKLLEHPGVRNCELALNPLHSELTEIALAAKPDFCVNAVIDGQRRIGGLFCGDMVKAHEAACHFAERFCVINTRAAFDIVVTTAGGYPLDTTYYQAIKGLVGALGILSAGGRIILVAECSKGIGSSEFYRVLQDLHNIGDYGAFIRHISDPENFILDQWEAEMLVKALRRAKVSLFSAGIAEEDWHLTHADRIASVEEALSIAIAGATAHPRVAVIPEGPYVIPVNDNIMMGLMA